MPCSRVGKSWIAIKRRGLSELYVGEDMYEGGCCVLGEVQSQYRVGAADLVNFWASTG